MKKFVLSFGFFLFLYLSTPRSLYALECGVAKVEPSSGGQYNNLTVCIADTYQSATTGSFKITAICRASPNIIEGASYITNASCHEEWQNALFLLTQPATKVETVSLSSQYSATTKKYFACYTLTGLDRNIGILETKIDQIGSMQSCTVRADVKPANYGGWQEYFTNTITTRANQIVSAIGATQPNPALCRGVGVETAFGCLMAGDPKQLISQLLGWGVVVGGGIAFVMILIAGFQITTAAGDPKKVQAARELLTAAISGLLLIVFSVLILNLIGFSILKLPGFSVPL